MDHVDLLARIVAGPVSGQALAEELGVSRTAVWKAVEQLRAEGLGIDSRGGYRLSDPVGFGPVTLAWRCGRPVTYRAECASTNRLAREAAAGDGPQVVVADHQSGGRGRLGRSWQSPPGQNLLFSVVMRPKLTPAEAPRCVLAWAAAIAGVLDVKLKWPNDLVDDEGRKLGGFLAELEAGGDTFGTGPRIRHVVLGLGLNVNQVDFPPDLPAATSLRVLRGHPHDRAALLGRMLRAVDAVDPGRSDALDPWRARAHTLGRRVRVGPVEGIAEALRDDGALIVDGQPVVAGDVELVGRPPDRPGAG